MLSMMLISIGECVEWREHNRKSVTNNCSTQQRNKKKEEKESEESAKTTLIKNRRESIDKLNSAYCVRVCVEMFAMHGKFQLMVLFIFILTLQSIQIATAQLAWSSIIVDSESKYYIAHKIDANANAMESNGWDGAPPRPTHPNIQ